MRRGQRLCQGGVIWDDGEFVGTLGSRPLGELPDLSRTELLQAVRPACWEKRSDKNDNQRRGTPEHKTARRGGSGIRSQAFYVLGMPRPDQYSGAFVCGQFLAAL